MATTVFLSRLPGDDGHPGRRRNTDNIHPRPLTSVDIWGYTMKDGDPAPLSFATVLTLTLIACVAIFMADIPWAKIGEALASMWR